MKFRSCLLFSSLFIGLLAGARGQMISVAVERHTLQNGTTTTAPNGAVFFATVEDVPGATGATVTSSTGYLTGGATLADDGDYYELQENRTDVTSLLTAFPLAASYTVAVAGAGSTTITGPGAPFLDRVPVNPLFTITGATPGAWGSGNVGLTAGSSFTITLNNYSVTTPGGHYAWYFSVGDSSSGYTQLGEVGAGPVPDATSYTAPTFTFTQGLPLDGGDSDDTTYGFTNGSQFYIEAGFFNGIVANSAISGVDQAFILGSVTGLSFTTTVSAIPEPSTYAAIFGALALVGAAWHRRRRAA